MIQATETGAAPVRTPLPGVDPAERLMELRAIGIYALGHGCGDLPMWKYFAELKHLSPKGMQAEVLEARIAICLAATIRPSGTFRAINDLRKLRRKAGQEHLFDAFEAFFQKAMGDRRFTNHGYGSANFRDMDHQPVWDRVSRHITVLGDKGHQVFLNSGTLLGVVRDQRLIDHDDDIDLAVILKAGSMADAAVEWASLTRDIRAMGLLDEAAFADPAIMKLLPIDTVQVDLFPMWVEDDRVFIYPHTVGDLGVSDVLPLEPCAVTGNPVPADPEAMLAINYGAGWRTPDPYFKFPWGLAKKNFAPFLSVLEDQR